MTLVGERVEVDVFEDGHMEVSRFKGDETVVGDRDLVYALIREETQARMPNNTLNTDRQKAGAYWSAPCVRGAGGLV